MPNFLCNKVEDCQYFEAPGSKTHYQKQLSLFPAFGTLKYLAMDILNSFPKTISGNQLEPLFAARYTELTRAIPVTTVTSRSTTAVFVEN